MRSQAANPMLEGRDDWNALVAMYYVHPIAGGPLEPFTSQWDALRYAYCKYGMAKFRLLTEAEKRAP